MQIKVWIRIAGKLLEAGGLLCWISAYIESLLDTEWSTILAMLFIGFAYIILGAYLEFTEIIDEIMQQRIHGNTQMDKTC